MSLINWIDLPKRGDERGSLVVVESGKDLPFEIKRVYYIYGSQADVPRGFHAHKVLRQVAVCVAGSCEMLLDNGTENARFLLDDPSKGVAVEPMVWHEMHNFSSDCVMVVFADGYYDESDYIRDYATFGQQVNYES